MSYLDEQGVHKAALIIVGNEILSGRTQDANTAWVAENLTSHGIVLAEVRVVPDIEEHIVDAVNALRSKVRYLFTTGGIGPTHDDITAASVAKALGCEMEMNTEALQILREYYGEENMTPTRESMALMPTGVELIPNAVSGAPGFIVDNVYVMAGVPRIMQSMLDYLLKNKLEHGQKILSNTIACSIPESDIADALADLQKEYDDVEIGSYPHFRGGVLGLNLVLRSTKQDRLQHASDAVVQLVKQLGGDLGAVASL